MQSHKTCVICVSFHGSEDTAKCVESLLASVDPVCIVVVDTTPNDPDIEDALKFAPEAVLIRTSGNLGYGNALNLGAKWALAHTACEFFLFLNNDAVVLPNSIGHLETAMISDPGIGVAAPRIVCLHDASVLWYGGGEIDWRRASAYTPGFNAASDAPLAMTERDVTFASGCALFARRSALEKLGGFDPRFFMYEEDVELCLRVRELGIRIRYIPQAVVLHRVQGSSRGPAKDRSDFWSCENPNLAFYAFHVMRNRLVNVYSHARGWARIVALAFFPLLILRRMIPFILGGRHDAVVAMFRGILDSMHARRNVAPAVRENHRPVGSPNEAAE